MFSSNVVEDGERHLALLLVENRLDLWLHNQRGCICRWASREASRHAENNLAAKPAASSQAGMRSAQNCPAAQHSIKAEPFMAALKFQGGPNEWADKVYMRQAGLDWQELWLHHITSAF